MENKNTDNDINELSSTSPNFRTDLAKKLEELVPEVIADGKVDVVKLKELLAEDAGEPNERFGLFWPGKKQALRAAQEPTTATLRPAKDESKDWDTTNNIFIEGDNLEVLKVLQKQYHNSIKMIYIDPPYNTGKDFVYPDNFKEGLQNYLEFSQQVDEGNKKISTNTETAGRYHSNWLNMMYPRLKLARNLLTDDGVIFISIDGHEYDNLLKLMLEIFGEANYVNTFTWVNNLKGRQISGHGAARTHEYIVCFAHKISLVNEFRANAEQLKKIMPSVYKGFDYEVKSDKYGNYVLKNELYNSNSAFNEETRPNLVFDIFYNPDTNDIKTFDVNAISDLDGYVKISPKVNNNGTHKYHAYRWGRDKVLSEFYNLEFVRVGDNFKIYTKVRDIGDTTVKDVIADINTTHGSSDIARINLDPKLFDFPKPMMLIYFLTMIGLQKGDVILDFFAGSGTTAHAIMQLNAEDGGDRKHIMVQLPEPTDEKSEAFKAGYKKISDIARERINRAGEKIKADFADKLAERETPLDVGYRTYKLADTNFTKWQSTPTGDLTELQARLDLMRESSNDNASEEDLLVEVLLKMGLPLTTRTKTVDVDELHVHQVVAEGDLSEGQPVLYLNEHAKPTLEQLRAIITDLTPSKFVILDDAFQGDNQLKTNLVQTCKSYDVELWTV